MALTAAEIGVVLTLTANMAVKVPTAFATGDRAYGRLVAIGVALLLAALWAGLLVSNVIATAGADPLVPASRARGK